MPISFLISFESRPSKGSRSIRSKSVFLSHFHYLPKNISKGNFVSVAWIIALSAILFYIRRRLNLPVIFYSPIGSIVLYSGYKSCFLECKILESLVMEVYCYKGLKIKRQMGLSKIYRKVWNESSVKNFRLFEQKISLFGKNIKTSSWNLAAGW